MGLNSRAFTSSTSSDYPKKLVKQEPDLNPSVGEIEPEIFFGPMAANFRNLQKELRQQVHFLPILRPLILMKMQREYTTDLESRLATKSEESAMLSRDLVRMESAQKQAVDRYRDALGKAAKKCGVAVFFLKFADWIAPVATPLSNPSWTILNAP